MKKLIALALSLTMVLSLGVTVAMAWSITLSPNGGTFPEGAVTEYSGGSAGDPYPAGAVDPPIPEIGPDGQVFRGWKHSLEGWSLEFDFNEDHSEKADDGNEYFVSADYDYNFRVVSNDESCGRVIAYYVNSDQVYLEAIPASGCKFEGWSVNPVIAAPRAMRLSGEGEVMEENGGWDPMEAVDGIISDNNVSLDSRVLRLGTGMIEDLKHVSGGIYFVANFAEGTGTRRGEVVWYRNNKPVGEDSSEAEEVELTNPETGRSGVSGVVAILTLAALVVPGALALRKK